MQKKKGKKKQGTGGKNIGESHPQRATAMRSGKGGLRIERTLQMNCNAAKRVPNLT